MASKGSFPSKIIRTLVGAQSPATENIYFKALTIRKYMKFQKLKKKPSKNRNQFSQRRYNMLI